MFTSYLKIALRNLLRNRVYSVINILGLALGVACCLLLSLYIRDEMSYDKHHKRGNDLYRIVTNFQSELVVDRTGAASPPIAMAIKEEVPEVETAVRVLSPPGVSQYFTTGEKERIQSLIGYEDNLFYEPDGLIADSTLFDVFTYDLLEGNPQKALVNGNSVVLSENLAHKLFGEEPALDKIISITQGGKPDEYKITGVFREKYNSHIKANFFTSMTSSGPAQFVLNEDEWAGQNFVPSYLKLVPGHDKAAVEKKMNDVLIRHGAESMQTEGIRKTLSLEPVADIYLKSDVGQSPRIRYLYVVGSIALFVLLIACINFMNLSTAKATRRATEIGIRKVMGAFRSSLIKQILGEAMVIVVVAITISFMLMQFALPFFNQLTNKNISFNTENITFFIFAAILLTIVTGLLAGSYPAFYLASFQPAQVLKGKFSPGRSSGRLRQTLVVFQFMIAIVLVCGVFIISRQLDFVMEKNLGFDTEAKIVLPLRTDEAHRQYEALKKELARSSRVEEVSGSSYIPGTPLFRDFYFYPDGGSMDKAVDISRNVVDAGYLELFKMKLIAGRSFTNNREMDSDHKLILNRTAVSRLGFIPEKIVGQNLHFDWLGEKYDFQVIGVMEDFHQNSLHEKIKPTLFEMEDDLGRYDYVIASVSSANFEQTVTTIEQTWKSLIHDTPFEYSFLDQTIQKQYDEDRRVSKIISGFGIIAMIICALGLYGLSSYMAERRFKEIGIRKVMGASVQQIVAMMSTEFVRLILIAFVIAGPVAYYGMSKWLEGFAYKVSIGWFVFVLAGLVSLAIALITVSFESIKSAMGNPIDSLRGE
ncbi:MAG TPA: ABC transporter permease [Cyclobacteriaceae bacterium]|nr:ABC transporter permease [Cyclobacteriaceae bacterium]